MWRGMDMGEALMAVIDPLEDHTMSDPRLASRFAVPRWTLQDTPLVRLRAFVLRERIKKEWWKARHLRGEVLVPDPLTKAKMQKSEWEKFYLLAGMVVPDEEKRAPYFKKKRAWMWCPNCAGWGGGENAQELGQGKMNLAKHRHCLNGSRSVGAWEAMGSRERPSWL